MSHTLFPWLRRVFLPVAMGVLLFVTLLPQPPAAAVVISIHDIQGAAHISPMNGQSVSGIQGIVTMKKSNGFVMEDPNWDANDATSEAIFVFTNAAPTANVGDLVTVGGTVAEFRPGGVGSPNLTDTEITSPTVTVNSAGNQLPALMLVGTGGRVPPNTKIEDDTTSDVETNNGAFDPADDGIDFWESMESMRLSVSNPLVVAPRGQFGGTDEIVVVLDDGANATGLSARKALKATVSDLNPERLVLRDAPSNGVTIAAADVGDHLVGTGSGVAPLVDGVLDYGLGTYKLLLTASTTTTSAGLARESTTTAATDQLAVASLNLKDLAPGDSRMAVIADRIVSNLKSPDLIAVQEVEDNNGATNDVVVSASTTAANLISAITTAGGPTYTYLDINPVDDQDGEDYGSPGANIRSGFLYRTDRGLALAAGTPGTSTSATTVVAGPHLSNNPGRVAPGDFAWGASRKPVAAEFTYGGKSYFAINVHFNNKSSDYPIFGHLQPRPKPSEGDRDSQAQLVNSFVDQILAADANARVIVLGDVNDTEDSSVMSTLKGGVLTNLTDSLTSLERYTNIHAGTSTNGYEGNAMALDHILVSSGLIGPKLGYDIVHTDAEFAFPTATTVLDHDPVVARFAKEYTLTVNKGGAGTGTVTSSPLAFSCGQNCSTESHDFISGTQLTLTAEPTDQHNTFTGWSGACSGTSTCQVTMSQARSVTANFGVETLNLTVSTEDEGTGNAGGTVTSTPAGINCGNTCTHAFAYNTSVTLAHTQDAGSVFVGWTGACTGNQICQVTMNQARSVTAVFGQDQFTLSVDADNGSGSGTVTSNIPGIDCGTICSHNYGRNTDVFLTAAPDPHSTFQGWSGDCSGGDPTACGVSMTDDKSVTALFVLDQFPVSLTKSGTGTGNVTSSPVGLACDATCNGASHNFDYGTEVTLTATPAAGSVLSGWTGDCSGTVANTCTVDVTDARSVEARFMQKLTIPSIATLTYSKATKKFKVKVSTSEMTSCRSGRKGAIKKVKPGPDATVKKFTTNGKGIAKVGLARVKGKYYVIVKTRKFTAANGAPVTCKATKSKPPLKLP